MPKALTDLVDNKRVTQWTLGEAVSSLLDQSEEPSLSIVTAYFNLEAFKVLQPSLSKISSLRLLVGKEQEQSFVLTERLFNEIQHHIAQVTETSSEIKRWRDFIAQGKVQVRVYRKSFLHGKAYLVEGKGISPAGAVGFVGSSNFTGAGLTKNLELNAVLMQQSAVDQLHQWFEALWSEAEDYKQELLEMLSNFVHPYSPYEIYIKVLYEAYRDRFAENLSEKEGKPSPIALADFQHDGYLAAKEILENYGGVLIADSVGLGKSYLALRLLDDYAYKERQTALVICPAALIDTLWRPLLQRFGIPCEIVSMERVSQKDFPADEFARFKIVVVDESHNFRNHNTNRWENLFRIITSGDPDKKLILMTATPVNNTVFDLYHQLRFITRDKKDFFTAANIPDLFRYFLQAEANKDALYEVLEAIAVRRSRQFIRANYPNAIIDGRKVRFPERRLQAVRYSLENSYGKALYNKIADAIENLFLAPYQVDTFRKEVMQARRQLSEQLSLFEGDKAEGLMKQLQQLGWSKDEAQKFVMSIGRQTALAYIMQVLYLKRLESSIESLRISLKRQRDFQRAFLDALNQGRLLDSKTYRRWLQMETTDEQAEDEPDLSAILDQLPTLPSDQYDLDALRCAVEADIKSLDELLEELEQVTVENDDKLRTLKELLTKDELTGKKLVVFSYFKDTARYLYRNLTNDTDFLKRLGHEKISIVDSGVKPEERKDRIIRFAPKANNRDDIPSEREILLLISTDVLSEGQNLQDADTLINYDLHWNPVRMVQRIGRLDRIGSPSPTIHVYNFFPEDALESLLGLLERLYWKLEAINRTVGLDESVLGEKPNPMDFNTLRRIARDDERVLDELEADSELTIGEFLMQDLLRFLKKVGEEKLSRIPLGVGTAMDGKGERRGFFAAFRNQRTNQHYWLFEDDNQNKIIATRLDAIRAIRCQPNEPPKDLPANFDHRPRLEKLRKHLLTLLRQGEHRLPSLSSPQNQIVNWLHAFPSSAERNELLAYFERPLTGLALRDLRKLWRERTRMNETQWIKQLKQFAQTHPHPEPVPTTLTEEITETDLECVGWVLVL